MPGADAKALPILVHLEAGQAPSMARRVACLGGGELKEPWRLSKTEATEISVLRGLIGAGTGLAEIAYRHGADTAHDVALLRGALFEQPLPDGMEKDIAAGAKALFPVKATDLMPEFEGPALGAKLKDLETRWIASGFALTKAALLG